MAATKRDARSTAEWLHTKLGGDESWPSTSIANMLTAETLDSIAECFGQLDSVVKVKVLLAFLSAPRSFFEECAPNAQRVLHAASTDRDQWLQVSCV